MKISAQLVICTGLAVLGAQVTAALPTISEEDI